MSRGKRLDALAEGLFLVGGATDDVSNIEDFIIPVRLAQAAEALLGADRILSY